MARVTADYGQGGYRMGHELSGVDRCPHCNIAAPLLSREWASLGFIDRTGEWPSRMWGAYSCRSCGGVTLVRGSPDEGQDGRNPTIDGIFPPFRTAHDDIPDTARRYLQQAYDTLHAPDAAAVMAGSAVDAMLKTLGYGNGASLYLRIDKALEDGHLTKGMAEWAHNVRLGSNRPRHADADRPHVSLEEAKQSVDFAEALGNFLFVLTARIERGIKAAEAAEQKE